MLAQRRRRIASQGKITRCLTSKARGIHDHQPYCPLPVVHVQLSLGCCNHWKLSLVAHTWPPTFFQASLLCLSWPIKLVQTDSEHAVVNYRCLHAVRPCAWLCIACQQPYLLLLQFALRTNRLNERTNWCQSEEVTDMMVIR
jgi:hypothetical protein